MQGRTCKQLPYRGICLLLLRAAHTVKARYSKRKQTLSRKWICVQSNSVITSWKGPN